MTEETIKKLDDLATKEVKRLGINVRRHEFFISSGDYPGRMDRDVFRIRPREILSNPEYFKRCLLFYDTPCFRTDPEEVEIIKNKIGCHCFS